MSFLLIYLDLTHLYCLLFIALIIPLFGWEMFSYNIKNYSTSKHSPEANDSIFSLSTSILLDTLEMLIKTNLAVTVNFVTIIITFPKKCVLCVLTFENFSRCGCRRRWIGYYTLEIYPTKSQLKKCMIYLENMEPYDKLDCKYLSSSESFL